MFVSDDVLRMVATARTLSLLLPLLAGGVASFSIVSVSEHAAPYTAGDTVQLGCRADGWWEYCSWTHGDTQCDLEWKYATVSIQASVPVSYNPSSLLTLLLACKKQQKNLPCYK